MKHRDEILDLVRGLSALVVLAAHVRGFLFQDFGDLSSPGPALKGFYFVTGIHHQAVMVFFVLSGYFVGGGVLKALSKGGFSWGRYAVARLSRLWVVLIPALLLTGLCDAVGREISLEAYSGAWREVWMSGPESGRGTALNPATFLGNLAFLQTVLVPVFGSNGPLWSLANEFWYYLVFPFLALGVWHVLGIRPARVPKVLLFFGLGAWLLWWLPIGLSSKGLVWLFGVGVWFFAKRIKGHRWWSRIAGLGGAVLFLVALWGSKTGSLLGSDYVVGLAFAIWMLGLIGPWPNGLGLLRPVGRVLSEISYTLYVTHFPLLFLFAAVVLKGRQFEPGPEGFALFSGLTTACLLVAGGMWWLFEKRTDQVRAWVSKKLKM